MSESGEAPKYESKTVRTMRGLEARARSKWESEGWEFVSQDAGRVQTTLTFRRPAPKSHWRLWTAGGAAFAVLLVVVITIGVVNERNAPPVTAPTPSETTVVEVSAEPVDPTPIQVDETPAPVVLPATDDEVLAAFRGFVDERATAGVLLAQAVTDVSFSERVVTVTVDPASVGYTETQFRELVPFENLAEIFVTPMAFNDDIGPRLRAAIDSVATIDASGASRGSRTTQWVVEANELD